MAAGICVLALHGLFVVGLANLSVKPVSPPPLVVRVSLLPPKPPPKLPPPPLPRFLQEPQIVAIQPRITIARPPPPDAVRATAQVRTPAEQTSPGPVKAPPPPGDYLSRLVAHLNAYKNYPYDARIHREQGTVQLRFSLNRSGRVLSYDVVGSSGYASLDNEVREMMARANPFPPVPPEYQGQSLDLVVPIVFSLN